MGRRYRKYSPDQAKAVREADAAKCEAANELMEDPEQVEALLRRYAGLPSIARFSERNQALLYTQAEERGMTLTEVWSYGQWQERGRQVVTGAKGLRIVAFRGQEATKQDDAPPPEPPTGDDKPGESKISNRFRMVSVFDISQTEDVGLDAEPVAEVAS